MTKIWAVFAAVLGLSAVEVRACDGRSGGSGANFGVYEFDWSGDQWVLVEAVYVPGLQDSPVEPEAEIMPSGSWSGGGAGGGGGGGPGTVVRGSDEGNKKPAVRSETPCLPTIIVTAVAPRPMGGGFASMTVSNGSRNGMVGWFRRLFMGEPMDGSGDEPDNPNRANCTSEPMDRIAHAAGDFMEWRVRTVGNMLSRGRGQRITVTYDDGGTETYIWIVGSLPDTFVPVETYLAPVSGTLRCPSGG